jgi:predicted  nucleic acid-binding Zn-ribbon protein
MDAEVKRFKTVSVPKTCQALHDHTLEFYNAQLEVLTKAIDMADYSKKASDLSKQAAGNPKKLVELKPQLEALEEEMGSRQKSMFDSLKKGQEADVRVKAERKKLEDEFHLPPAAEPTPGAIAAPAAATGTPAPAKP